MIEFGKSLRTARETKGLTISQIAEKTHLLVQIVEGLENEDFSRIVAPIYGRGFVKLYCEAVGLEPKPFVDEFMEIYLGNRAPVIRERAVESVPVEPQKPTSAPTPAPAPVADPVAQPEATIPPVSTPEFDFSEKKADPLPERFSASPSRYAAPQPIDDASRYPGGRGYGSPLRTKRLLILAAATLLVLWAIVAGIRSLYRATMSAPTDATPAISDAPAAPARATVSSETIEANRNRKPLKLQPLYIDGFKDKNEK